MIDSFEVNIAQVRACKVRPIQIRAYNVRPARSAPSKVRPPEVRPVEVRPVEVRPAEVRVSRSASSRFAALEVDRNSRIACSPLIPGFWPLSENIKLFLVSHKTFPQYDIFGGVTCRIPALLTANDEVSVASAYRHRSAAVLLPKQQAYCWRDLRSD